MEPHQLTSEDKVLSNSLVLANVFEFLPHKDLKRIRLVSRSWRDICTPILRRKSYVRLNSDEDLMLTGFLQAFPSTPADLCLPFREFSWIEANCDSDEMKATFWERWGPSMEAINLYEVTLVGVEIVRDILFNLCPKLKEIDLVDCSLYKFVGMEERTEHKEIAPLDGNVRVNKNLISLSYRDYRNLTFPLSWEELFIAYPNLRDLHLGVTATVMDSILEIALALRKKDPRRFQLQKLAIYNAEFSSHTMKLLDCLKLSLKELWIHFETNVTSQVAHLLQQQVLNLEKLTLYMYGGQQRGVAGIFPPGIQFDRLKYLTITDNFLDSISFIGLMPNLSTLELFGSSLGLRNNAIARTDLTEMPLQTKLTDLRIYYEISSLDVKKLVHWFPGVVKAELYLDNESFRSVCMDWRKLEKLNVMGKNLTTEGITGIYELKLRNLEPYSTIDIPQMEYNPVNITCLTNLRQFTMRHGFKPVAIDDACVDHGFLKLPHLNYLDICSTHISDEGWTKLFNWSQLQTLKASNGNRKWEGAKTFSK